MNIKPSSMHDTGRRTETPELKIDSVAPRNHASRPPLILASILGSVSGGLPMGPGQPYLTYLISEVGEDYDNMYRAFASTQLCKPLLLVSKDVRQRSPVPQSLVASCLCYFPAVSLER